MGAQLSIAETIEIGELSICLSSNDRQKKALFSGSLNTTTPLLIAMATDATAWGLESYPVVSGVFATATITVTGLGVDGDTIEVLVDDPVLGSISLGTYTQQSSDTTTTILAASITSTINGNPYGYSATSNGAVITLTARPGLGAAVNGGSRVSVVTTTFSPADLPNLWSWYDAGVGVTGTTTVTQWADQSGNGRDLISETGQEPTLVEDELNGNPVVGVASAVCRMRTADTFPDASQELSVYIVGKQDVGGGALADSSGHFFSTGANSLFLRRNFNGVTSELIYSQFKLTTLTFGLTNDTYSSIRLILSPNDNKLAIDNVVVNTNTGALFDLGSDRLNVFSNATGAQFGNKQIAEFLIYTDKHDASQIAQVEAYLNNKYALY